MQTSDVDQVIILNPDTDVMALDSIYLIHLKKVVDQAVYNLFYEKKAVPRTAKNNIILLTYFFLKTNFVTPSQRGV